MAATPKQVVQVNPMDDDLDLDVIAVSPNYTVMRGRTWAIATGRTSHYDKVTIVEAILPDETEQEFRERMTLLITREAQAELDAFDTWMKENGL